MARKKVIWSVRFVETISSNNPDSVNEHRKLYTFRNYNLSKIKKQNPKQTRAKYGHVKYPDARNKVGTTYVTLKRPYQVKAKERRDRIQQEVDLDIKTWWV